MKVKHYLCANTWVDTKVCNPVPLSWEARGAYLQFPEEGDTPYLYQTRPEYGSQIITRYGRGKQLDGKILGEWVGSNWVPMKLMFYGTEPGSTTDRRYARIWGFDELNPCYIEITSRAPVNINSASKAVLVAVLSYLEGFFALEQLRAFDFGPAIGSPVDFLGSQDNRCDLSTLYRTYPITPLKAGEIADRIIERRANKPFSSWQDFNRFINSLVGSVISDDPLRGPAYYQDNTDPWKVGNGWLYPVQCATQAIADTIKANANPNLHLNEINPDAEIWQWVDKTDLIKNSTEFCFIPTGVFEIESVGMVLRPQPQEGQPNDSLRVQNLLRGKRKIITEVKLYDIYRESTQRDFYRGEISPSGFETNNMKTLETGPEPDQGLASYENNYEGYIILSTRGGTSQVKPKGVVGHTSANPSCDIRYGSNMHAHYNFDFNLHCNEGRDIATGLPIPNLRIEPLTKPPSVGQAYDLWCRQDKTEEGNPDYSSPYCLAYNPRRYRIARSYVYDNSLGSMPLTAPIDHRIDGAYCERWAWLPYYSEQGAMNIYNGSLSYWIKPNFLPEFNSQARAFADMSLNVSYCFCHYLTWGTTMISTTTGCLREDYSFPSGNYLGQAFEQYMYVLQRPVSLTFMITGQEYRSIFLPQTGSWEKKYYAILSATPTLNHNGHSVFPANINHIYTPDKFSAHKWIHTTVSWGSDQVFDTNPEGIDGDRPTDSSRGPVYKNRTSESETRDRYCRIFVNGRILSEDYGTYYFYKRGTGVNDGPWKFPSPGGSKQLVIGGKRSSNPRTKADATMDEFYLWERNMDDPDGPNGPGNNYIKAELWGKGRYYHDTMSPIEFASGGMDFSKLRWGSKGLGGHSSDKYPDGGDRPSGVDLSYIKDYSTLVLGVSWTAWTDGIHDYRPTDAPGVEPERINAECNLWVSLDNGATYVNSLPMRKYWWQWIWRNIESENLLRYKVKFDIDALQNAILLESPIFDDISIYYRGGKIEFLTWVLV
jgi:hypothetical protein